MTEDRLRKTNKYPPNLLYLQIIVTITTACHAGPHGKATKMVRKQKSGAREGLGQAMDYIGVSKGQANKGKVNNLGLANLNNFSGL